MMKIKKKLLSKILGTNVREVGQISRGKIWYYSGNDTLPMYISTDSLYFKIKNWAKDNDFNIWTGCKNIKYDAIIYTKGEKIDSSSHFYSDSDLDSMVKAAVFVNTAISLLSSNLV